MASQSRNRSGKLGHTVPTAGIAGRTVAGTRRIWRVLEFSGTYLALVAVVEVLIVRYLLDLGPSPAPVLVGLVTYAVYANDRLVDLETDAASNPRRSAFVRRHRDFLYVSAAVAYGIGVALSVLGGPVAFALALLPGGAWVLYAVDWVPAAVPFGRLKEILVVNSVLVATAWSLAVVCLPLAFAGRGLSPAAGTVFAYFALATFVNTEVANACDVESDRTGGVATVPVVLGTGRTRQFLSGVVLIAGGVVGYATLSGSLTVGAATALGVGLAGLWAVVSLLGRVQNRLLPVVAECTRLPVFAVLLVGLA